MHVCNFNRNRNRSSSGRCTHDNDQADEDPAVIDCIEQQGLLSVLAAHSKAAKEVTQQYLTTISREIAFRDAQMKARLY